jgi:hypothetical protein
MRLGCHEHMFAQFVALPPVCQDRDHVWLPTFLIGPALALRREVQQRRRRVMLTVHRAVEVGPMILGGGQTPIAAPSENLYITITNASHTREVEVTHVWLDTVPPLHVYDRALPVRLKYGARWETMVLMEELPDGTEDPEWLARCMITPDDKVIKSKPRKNVPPFGAVPRGV